MGAEVSCAAADDHTGVPLVAEYSTVTGRKYAVHHGLMTKTETLKNWPNGRCDVSSCYGTNFVNRAYTERDDCAMVECAILVAPECVDCFDVPPVANDDMVTGTTHIAKYYGSCAFEDASTRGPING